jgi:hypothetical protein
MRCGTHVCADPRGDTEHITNCDLSWNEARPKIDRSFLLLPAILQRDRKFPLPNIVQAKSPGQDAAGRSTTGGNGSYANLTVKKIPKAVLSRCEWGKDDYSLKVENPPKVPRRSGQRSLFGEEAEVI